MKRKVMFVGGLPSYLLGVLDFKRFGQVEELDEELIADAARGGCVILPADDPAALAFAAEELQKRASFGSHASAPVEFREKVRLARIAAARFAEASEEAFQLSLEPQIVGVGEEVTRV